MLGKLHSECREFVYDILAKRGQTIANEEQEIFQLLLQVSEAKKIKQEVAHGLLQNEWCQEDTTEWLKLTLFKNFQGSPAAIRCLEKFFCIPAPVRLLEYCI